MVLSPSTGSKRCAAGIALLFVAQAAGSQSSLPNPDLAILGKALTGLTGSTAPSPNASLTFTPREGNWQYLITSGTTGGTKITEALTKLAAGPTVVWRRTWDPGHVTDFVVSPGVVFKTRITDPDHQLEFTYTPGEPELVSGMTPGETRHFSYSVRVNKLSDPSFVNASGQMAVDFTYLGQYRFATAAGELLADGFRKALTGRVGPTESNTTLHVFYSAGIGEVARIDHTEIHALVLFNRDSRTGYVLDQLPVFTGP